MKIRITIDCDNAAFGDDEASRSREIRSILGRLDRRLQERTEEAGEPIEGCGLRDTSGNTVGHLEVFD